MKRFVSVLVLAVMSLTFVTGCKKKDTGIPFDYDLEKYIKLGDVVGVEYTYKVAEVTDEAVTEYINSALKEKGYGEEIEVKEGKVQNGDTANIDFEGLMDGKNFEGGSAKGTDLVIGSNSFIDGFERGLIGVEIGDTVTLDLEFPDPYQNNMDFSGKPVQFITKVNSVKRTVYPELTDEIVKEISDEITTVDAYKKYANDMVQYNNETNAVDEMESEIWSKIIDSATVIKYPTDEVEKYKNLIIKQMDNLTNQQYGITYEEYLDQSMGKTLEDVDSELTKEAENAVKQYMTVVAIARDRDLVPTDEEYNKEVEEYAKKSGYTDVSEFLEAIDKEQFYLSILVSRVMDFVVENAVEVSE